MPHGENPQTQYSCGQDTPGGTGSATTTVLSAIARITSSSSQSMMLSLQSRGLSPLWGKARYLVRAPLLPQTAPQEPAMTCSPMIRTFLPDKSSGGPANPKSGPDARVCVREAHTRHHQTGIGFTGPRRLPDAFCQTRMFSCPQVFPPPGAFRTSSLALRPAGSPTADTTRFTSARPASHQFIRPLSMAQHPRSPFHGF